MNRKMLMFLFCLVLLFTVSCRPKTETVTESASETVSETVSITDIEDLVRDYDIVKVETDNYSNEIRYKYRVVVPSDITVDELKATIMSIVDEKIAASPSIDGLVFFVYDNELMINEGYTAARVTYAPNGKLEDITYQIAELDDKGTYDFTWEIKSWVGNPTWLGDPNYLHPTDLEIEIYEYYTNLLTEETANLYDAQAKGVSYKYADEEELDNEIAEYVAEKYDISVDELNHISLKVSAFYS